MLCDFKYVGPSEKKAGFKKYRCQRGACKRIGHSPYEPDRVDGPDCDGVPHVCEFGNWLELFIEVFCVTKRPWLWLKWRLGFRPACNCEQRIEALNAIGAEGLPLHWPAVG